MAYFPNGTSFDIAAERWCNRCVHQGSCTVLDLHLLWNYEAVGKDADQTKHQALETLWPSDGIFPGDCSMFFEKSTGTG